MGLIEKFKDWRRREGKFVPIKPEERTDKQHLLAKKSLMWTMLALVLLVPFAFLEVFIFKTILQTEFIYIVILLVSFFVWFIISKNAVRFGKESGSPLSYYLSNAAVVIGAIVISLCLFMPLLSAF